MDHDYTLEELFGIARNSINTPPHCKEYDSKWCISHKCCSECREHLIKAIERKAAEEWQRGYDEGFASADDWCAEHEDAMAEHGWVRGPIGADGKPIAKEHMVVDNGGNVGVIVETRFNDDNWFVLVDFGEGVSTRFVWFLPKSLSHYHAPTVEDVLDEIVDKANHVGCAYASNDMSGDEMMDALKAIITEFAPRLRLAGDDE